LDIAKLNLPLIKNINPSDIAPTQFTDENIKVLSEIVSKTNSYVESICKLTEHADSSVAEKIELYEKFNQYKKLFVLFSRIHPDSIKTIAEDTSNLHKNLLGKKSLEMAVMSVDIRKSTALMVKAKTNNGFAEFLSSLADNFKDIVIRNYGIFDKFTGDGILAFFPVCYTGKNAMVYCYNAAKECHDFFKKHYESNCDKFKMKLQTGLGIGIDYGDVEIAMPGNELTIVGESVVYACRLSSAPISHTYITQGALTEINNKCKVTTSEVNFDIKHEDTAIVFDVVDCEQINLNKPEWN
jgi:hypothetical protein